MRRGAAGVALLAAACVGACGRAGPTLPASSIAPPTAAATPMASHEVDTSPDGGIYRNPDTLEVLSLWTGDAAPIADLIGSGAGSWSELRPLGHFTLLGLRLHNAGKAGSEPALSDLQVASDHAPPGTSTGPLRRFYHPTFPLATLSDVAIAGDCTVHLDPGQTATVVLVYPPLRDDQVILWGRYQEFVLRLHRGGGLGGLDADLHVGACTPPSPG